MLSWYGLLSLAGLVVAGLASDLISSKFPIALTFVLRFGLFLLAIRLQTLTSFYIFAAGLRLHPSDHRASHSDPRRTAVRVVACRGHRRTDYHSAPPGRWIVGVVGRGDFRSNQQL